MKINYALISRALIALVFVIAGLQKVMSFAQTSSFIGSLGLPMPEVVTALVIVVEIPVALAFAWGYRLCYTGIALAVFTVLATLLVHNHLPGDLVMILKNIAILGGLLGAVANCACGTCPIGKSKNG